MIKMIGSKRTMIPYILEVTKGLKYNSVIDLFSGTSRVGQEFKKQDKYVIANDNNYFAYIIAKCYIEYNDLGLNNRFGSLLTEIENFNFLEGKEGYFTDTFCKKALYFQPKNGMKIDAIRDYIKNYYILNPVIEAVFLTSLMEAADKVDNTCGLQMAYLKYWCDRSYKDIKLELPELLKVNGKAIYGDALDCLKNYSADLIYMDPPYNQHSYAGNYHIWNTLCHWDNPEYYGIANKRKDVKDYYSPFNRKNEAGSALWECIKEAKCKYLLISFNNEGYISMKDMLVFCNQKGRTTIVEIPNKRYIGSQIGQHNLEGIRVGTITHTENKEYLFLIECY